MVTKAGSEAFSTLLNAVEKTARHIQASAPKTTEENSVAVCGITTFITTCSP